MTSRSWQIRFYVFAVFAIVLEALRLTVPVVGVTRARASLILECVFVAICLVSLVIWRTRLQKT